MATQEAGRYSASIPAFLPEGGQHTPLDSICGALQMIRASTLAQTRLHLAALSGDRQQVLKELDRLMEIDRGLDDLLQAMGRSTKNPELRQLGADLAEEMQALISDRLVLTAGIRVNSAQTESAMPEAPIPAVDENDSDWEAATDHEPEPRRPVWSIIMLLLLLTIIGGAALANFWLL